MRSEYADGDADVVNSTLCASGVSGINWQGQYVFLSKFLPLSQCQPTPPTESGLTTSSVCVCECATDDAVSMTTSSIHEVSSNHRNHIHIQNVFIWVKVDLSVCVCLKMTNVHFPGLQKNLFHCIFIIISYHLDLGPCSCHCASMLQKKSYSLILAPHSKPGVRWCSSNGVIVGFWCSRQKYNQAAMCSQLCTLYLIDTWRWKGRYIGGH